MLNNKLLLVFKNLNQKFGKELYNRSEEFYIQFNDYAEDLYGKYDGIIELLCENQVFKQLIILSENLEIDKLVPNVADELSKASNFKKDDIEEVCLAFLHAYYEKTKDNVEETKEVVRETIVEKEAVKENRKKEKAEEESKAQTLNIQNINTNTFIDVFEIIKRKNGMSVFDENQKILNLFSQECKYDNVKKVFKKFIECNGIVRLKENAGNDDDIIFDMTQDNSISFEASENVCAACVQFLGIKKTDNKFAFDYSQFEKAEIKQDSIQNNTTSNEKKFENLKKEEDKKVKEAAENGRKETSWDGSDDMADFLKRENKINRNYDVEKKYEKIISKISFAVVIIISILMVGATYPDLFNIFDGKPVEVMHDDNDYYVVTESFICTLDSIEFYKTKTVANLTFENYYADSVHISQAEIRVKHHNNPSWEQTSTIQWGPQLSKEKNIIQPNGATQVSLIFDDIDLEPGMYIEFDFSLMHHSGLSSGAVSHHEPVLFFYDY